MSIRPLVRRFMDHHLFPPARPSCRTNTIPFFPDVSRNACVGAPVEAASPTGRHTAKCPITTNRLTIDRDEKKLERGGTSSVRWRVRRRNREKRREKPAKVQHRTGQDSTGQDSTVQSGLYRTGKQGREGSPRALRLATMTLELRGPVMQQNKQDDKTNTGRGKKGATTHPRRREMTTKWVESHVGWGR